MINKHLQATFAELTRLKTPHSVILQTDNELLNGYPASILKTEKGFSVDLDFIPFKGFSSAMLNAIKFQTTLILKSEGKDLLVSPKSILLNSYNFPGDDGTLKVEGSITQIATAELNQADNKFIRAIIPVLNGHPKIRDIMGFHYQSDLTGNERHLIKVLINDCEFHFFSFKNESGFYLIIDSTVQVEMEQFQKVVANICNAFGFIFGDLFLDEGYFISSAQESFEVVDDIFYSTYRDSILSGYSLYTTNPYSVYNVTGKTRAEIDSQIEEIRKWYTKIIEFSDEVFSKLCELFLNKEPFSRAAIITLQANTLALEIKGSSYSIALEAIGNQILKDHGIKFPKPIPDENKATDLKKGMMKLLDENFPAGDPANKDVRAIIGSKINNLNNPSNADKLKMPFTLVGYTLNDKEFKAIKSRDIFQHGNLPADADSEDSVFADVYYYCLLLHRLIAILILKTAGFEGYIVNYPELHSHITAKSNEEDLLYKI